MATGGRGGFSITGQILLTGPTNLNAVTARIQRSFQSINATVNVNIPRNAFTQVSQLNTNLSSLNSTVQALNARAAQANGLSSLSSSMSSVAKSAKGAESAAYKLGTAIGQSARRFGAFVVGAGTLISFITSIKDGISKAVDFQHQMVRLQQVSSGALSGVSEISKEITRLGVTLGTSSEELAGIAVTLKQAGLSAKDTQIALGTLAQTSLAPTFDDIKNSTEGVIAVMQQFNVKASELTNVFGGINRVSADFAVEAEDIVHVIRRSGGAFKAAGGELNQLIALFTSVRSTTRESAETIASGFNTIFARLQRPQAVEQLKLMGIYLRYTTEEAKAFGKTAGEFVGPYEAVKRLNEALANVPTGSAEYAAIVEQIGGFRQVSKVIPLLQQFETSEKALGSAIYGQTSLLRSNVLAQQSAVVQIGKLKEEFLSLFRELSGNKTLQGIGQYLLAFGSIAVKVAKQLEPLIPLVTAFASFAIARTAFRFTRPGFVQGVGHGLGQNHYATGGVVGGTGNRDTVKANLTPGEFVVTKPVARAIGYDKLNQLNKGKADVRQNFADGGRVGNPDYKVRYTYKDKAGQRKVVSSTINAQNQDMAHRAFRQSETYRQAKSDQSVEGHLHGQVVGGQSATRSGPYVTPASPASPASSSASSASSVSPTVVNTSGNKATSSTKPFPKAPPAVPYDPSVSLSDPAFASARSQHVARNARAAERVKQSYRRSAYSGGNYSNPVAYDPSVSLGDPSFISGVKDHKKSIYESKRTENLKQAYQGDSYQRVLNSKIARGLKSDYNSRTYSNNFLNGQITTAANYRSQIRDEKGVRFSNKYRGVPGADEIKSRLAQGQKAELDARRQIQRYVPQNELAVIPRLAAPQGQLPPPHQKQLDSPYARSRGTKVTATLIPTATNTSNTSNTANPNQYSAFRSSKNKNVSGAVGKTSRGYVKDDCCDPILSRLDKILFVLRTISSGQESIGGGVKKDIEPPAGPEKASGSKFGKLQIAGLIATAAAQYAPSAAEKIFGTVENPTGLQSHAQTATNVASALSTAAIGAAVGGSAGGIPGAVIGGLGGALYGFWTSLEETSEKIRSIQFDKDFKAFDTAIKRSIADSSPISNRSIGGIRTGIEKILEEAKVSKNPENFYATKVQPNDFQALLDKLAKTSGINKDTTDESARSSILSTQQGLGKSVVGLLTQLPEFKDQSVNQILQQFIESAKKSDIDKVRREQVEVSRKEIATQIQSYTHLSAAIDRSTGIFEQLNSSLETTSSVFEGGFKHAGISQFSKGAESFGVDSSGSQVIDSIKFVRNALGDAAGTFSKDFDAIHEAFALLPQILSITAKKGIDADSTGTHFKEAAEGVLGAGANKSVVQRLHEVAANFDPSELLKKIHDDPLALLEEFKKAAYVDPTEILKKATSSLEANFNTYSSNLEKNAALLGRVRDSENARISLELQASENLNGIIGRRSGISGQHLSLTQKSLPFNARQASLVNGSNISGGGILDPEVIAEKLDSVLKQIPGQQDEVKRTLTEETGNPGQGQAQAALAAQKKLQDLGTEANNLKTALEHLANPVERNAILQERLNDLNSEAAQRLSLAEKYFVASPGERNHIDRTVNVASAVSSGFIDPNQLGTQMRQELISLSHELDDIVTDAFGGVKGKDFRASLLKNNYDPSIATRANLRPGDENRRTELENLSVKVFADAAKAQEALSTLIGNEQEKFFDKLSNNQKVFLNNFQLSVLKGDKEKIDVAGIGLSANVAKQKEADDAATKLQVLFPGFKDLSKIKEIQRSPEFEKIIAGAKKNRQVEENTKNTKSLQLSPDDLKALPAVKDGVSGGLGVTIPADSSARKEALKYVIRNKLDVSPATSSYTGEEKDKLTSNIFDRVGELVGKRRDGVTNINPIIDQQAKAFAREKIRTNDIDIRKNTELASNTHNVSIGDVTRVANNAELVTKLLEKIGNAETYDAIRRTTDSITKLSEANKAESDKKKAQIDAIPPVSALPKASGGSIFKPKGTDTVPAILTPGEFVVSKGPAQRNAALLKQINSGRAVYAADGGEVGLQTPFSGLSDIIERVQKRKQKDLATLLETSPLDTSGYNLSDEQKAAVIERNTKRDSDGFSSVNDSYGKIAIADRPSNYVPLVERRAKRGRQRRQFRQFNGIGQGVGQGFGFGQRQKVFVGPPDPSKRPTSQISSDEILNGVHSQKDIQFNFNKINQFQKRLGNRQPGNFSREDLAQARATKRFLESRLNEKNKANVSQGEIEFYSNALKNFNISSVSHAIALSDRRRSGSGLGFFADGGLSRGTDVVPAMLTPGEFIVNSSAAQQHAPLLHAINRSKGGPVYLADGGSVNTRMSLMESRYGATNSKPQGDAMSGSKELSTAVGTFFQSVQSLKTPFESFNVSATNLGAGMALFNKTADGLAKAMSNLSSLPTTITVQGSTQVIVTVTGLEAFKALQSQMQEDIAKAVSMKLKPEIAASIKNGTLLA